MKITVILLVTSGGVVVVDEGLVTVVYASDDVLTEVVVPTATFEMKRFTTGR